MIFSFDSQKTVVNYKMYTSTDQKMKVGTFTIPTKAPSKDSAMNIIYLAKSFGLSVLSLFCQLGALLLK